MSKHVIVTAKEMTFRVAAMEMQLARLLTTFRQPAKFRTALLLLAERVLDGSNDEVRLQGMAEINAMLQSYALLPILWHTQ